MRYWSWPIGKAVTFFFRLRPSEQCLVVWSAVLLGIARVSLVTAGFKRTAAWFCRPDRALRGNVDLDTDWPKIRNIGRLVNIAARNDLTGPNCLRSSLVTSFLLRRRGYPAELRIGVRSGEQRLQAHAWVEVGGRVVNDTPDVAERFPPFSDLARTLEYF